MNTEIFSFNGLSKAKGYNSKVGTKRPKKEKRKAIPNMKSSSDADIRPADLQ